MTTFKLTKNFKIISRLLSDQNLTQKAYMNALAATLDYGARLVIGFIVTPFLVAGLGDSLYGVWRTLGNLTGYLSAASGRPSQALKWTIANLQGSTNYEEKRRQVASALIVWLLFLPLLTTLGAALVWFVPFWIKDLRVEYYVIVRLAAGLLVADMIVTTLTVLPQSILEGENLGYKRMGLSATLVFVGGGLAMLALYLNTGLVGVAVAELTTTLLTGLFFLYVMRSYVPWFGLAKPSRHAVREFFGLSWWFLVWRLVIQLMTASDLVILGMFASAGLVTTYALTKYAPETMINIVAIVVFGSTPGLGGIIGSGDLQKAARVRNEIMLLTWLVTTIIGSTILLWNQAFIGLWVGSERFAGTIPNFLALLLIVQFVLIRNDANIIDLTLVLSHKVLLGLLSAVFSVVTAAILVGFYNAGITGLILGLIAGRSILSLAYPLIIGRYLGVSLHSQFKGALRPTVVTLLLFFLAASLDSWLNSGTPFVVGWISLFFLVLITAGVASLLAFFLGLSGDQQKRIFERVRLVITNAPN
jgi:O-antigen/teichoic acid export membrane protein